MLELAEGLKDTGDEINESLYGLEVSAFEDHYTFQQTFGVGVTIDTIVLESGSVLTFIDRLVLIDLERKLEADHQ